MTRRKAQLPRCGHVQTTLSVVEGICQIPESGMHAPMGQPFMQACRRSVRAGSDDAIQACRMALTRRGELQLPTGGAPGRMTSRQASFIVSGWESPGCLTGNLLRRRRTGP